MDLPRRKGRPVAEKAAVDRHLAGINLFVRLLNQFHVAAPFSRIGGAIDLPPRKIVWLYCDFVNFWTIYKKSALGTEMANPKRIESFLIGVINWHFPVLMFSVLFLSISAGSRK